jgi:hypothetical protein
MTQPNAGGQRDLALGSMGFWWAGSGLINSNQLATQDFQHLSQLSFGNSAGSGGVDIASSLLIQMWALPTGSTSVYEIHNFQNAAGYFTGVTAAVPEPGTWALMAGGGLMLGWRARRRTPAAGRARAEG